MTWNALFLWAILFLVSLAINFVVIAIVMVKIPANYFSTHYKQDFRPHTSWLTRWGTLIAKNVAGLILFVLGIVMLIGPGQGILSILTGIILMDIPGKRPFEARLIKRPPVLAVINKLRTRYGKPPLELD